MTAPLPIDIRLLGSVRLPAGGRRVDLDGPRIQTVPAVLAIERGVALSVE